MFRSEAVPTSVLVSHHPSSALNQLQIDDIEGCVAGDQYHVFPGTCVTVCCLTLHNGFVVTGVSVAVDGVNFHRATARAAARQNAIEKVWGLERYRLKEWLNSSPGPLRTSIRYSPSEMAPLNTQPVDLDTTDPDDTQPMNLGGINLG